MESENCEGNFQWGNNMSKYLEAKMNIQHVKAGRLASLGIQSLWEEGQSPWLVTMGFCPTGPGMPGVSCF